MPWPRPSEAAAGAARAPAASENTARTARERSQLYRLLAEVFRAEPAPALLRTLRGPELGPALAAAGASPGRDILDGEEGAVLEELAVEYAQLFLGPGPHIAPYASVYLSGPGGSLWGPATIEAKAMMEEAGFALCGANGAPPDHIAIELEFMQRLCEGEARAVEDGEPGRAAHWRGTQGRFLRTHLGRWLPGFCRRVEAAAGLSLYRDMAALARAFVATELEAADDASSPSLPESSTDP